MGRYYPETQEDDRGSPLANRTDTATCHSGDTGHRTAWLHPRFGKRPYIMHREALTEHWRNLIGSGDLIERLRKQE
jgi:hypothetical protein